MRPTTAEATTMPTSPMMQARGQSQMQSQAPAEAPPFTGAGPGREPLLFQGYAPRPSAWDELFAAPGKAHEFCQVLVDRLGRLDVREFLSRRTSADLSFINNGVTFSVYSDRRGTEKIFPFDLIPRPV